MFKLRRQKPDRDGSDREAPPAALRALKVFWASVGGVSLLFAGVLQVLGPVAPEAPPDRNAGTELGTGTPTLPVAAAPTTSAATGAATARSDALPSGASGAAGRPIPPPDPDLLEPGRHGALPRVSSDGRTSIRAYGRAIERSDTRPRAAILLGGMGISSAATEEALRRLPPSVSLAFSPYSNRLTEAVEVARRRGMEFSIELPLEPAGYPMNDPGDRALLTGLPMAENLDRLEWALSRLQGYVGAVGSIGSMRGERFAAAAELLGATQDVLRARGVLYVDPRPGAPQPERAWGRSADLVLDEVPSRAEIERRLNRLEEIARERGSALAVAGSPTPVLVEAISAWAEQVESRGVMVAPVSSILRRPEGVQRVPASR